MQAAELLPLWQDLVRDAAARGERIRIHGGGSKAPWWAAVQHSGVDAAEHTLDTTALSGIVNFEPTELVITARAGTPLADIEAALAAQNQYLPFEPPHFARADAGTATVGGAVASALSGPARVSAGGVRDYVLGATLLNGKGEVLRFGGEVMKNVAGFDVSRLLCGSLGSLGVIVDVSLKVLPLAPAEASLRFSMTQDEAITRCNTWAAQPLSLNASAWLPDRNDAGNGTLTLRLRGAQAAVQAAQRSLGGDRVPEAEAAAFFSLELLRRRLDEETVSRVVRFRSQGGEETVAAVLGDLRFRCVRQVEQAIAGVFIRRPRAWFRLRHDDHFFWLGDEGKDFLDVMEAGFGTEAELPDCRGGWCARFLVFFAFFVFFVLFGYLFCCGLERLRHDFQRSQAREFRCQFIDGRCTLEKRLAGPESDVEPAEGGLRSAGFRPGFLGRSGIWPGGSFRRPILLCQQAQFFTYGGGRFRIGIGAVGMAVKLLLEHVGRFEEDIDHLAARRHLALAQPVQQVLQDMGDIRHVGEAESAAAALDGMRGAENGVHFLGVGRIDVHFEQQAFHFCQVFRTFVEEHLVELAHVYAHDSGARG
ncbi:putative FAD-linked oxidoreductase [mine drainage metagenome]|uniref:Putative FAD-linked oxidoreductase n=1 Tax=mine drainage metagenome TaxID=410659 RepID=A0A1J5PY06_9ZZZZ